MPLARRLAGFGLAALVLAADLWSKHWVLFGLDLPQRGSVRVLPVLNLTLVWNHGVTFGLLNGAHAAGLLVIIAAAAVAALSIWLWRARHLTTTLAVGAIIGGAIGNVISRVQYGAVVDFIQAHVGGWSWYVFNIADAAIVCGVTALILEGLLRDERRPHRLPGREAGDREAR